MLLNSQTLCFEWLRSKKGKIKPSTYDKYDMILNKYLLDFFNNYHLDQLDISIIKDYFISLLDQGLSSSVVQSIKNVLKAIYITYENQYGLNHIDFSLVKIEQEKKENASLLDEQFNQLHQYCLNTIDAIHLGILLAMDTGMMIGEICALKVSDIDLNKKMISITKRTQRVKNEERGSKTIYEVADVEWPIKRNIAIPQSLIKYLEIYLKDKNKNDYLLSNNQHASDFKKLQRGLDKITQQLGFKTTYKDLRNMYKEHCMKKCLDVNVVMELLGLQSMKLSLPQDYNSSDEEKIKQVNKL